MNLPAELKVLLDRPVAYHRCFVTLTGSIEAALMLGQACYWQQRTASEDGYWYKRRWEWQEEISLNRYQQEQARAALRSHSWWHEEMRGVPAKLYFRVDFGALLDELAAKLADRCPQAEGKPTGRQLHSRGVNKTSKDAEDQPGNTETPTQTTTETTGGGDVGLAITLSWPRWLNSDDRARCVDVLLRLDRDGWSCPPTLHQAALDVLAAAATKNKRISSPDGYLLGVVKRIKDNTFVPMKPPGITEQRKAPDDTDENRAALQNERRLLEQEMRISLKFADQAERSNKSLAAAHRDSARKKTARIAEIEQLLTALPRKSTA